MTGKNGEELITQADAARIRGVTRSAIAELIRRGRLRTEEKYGRRLVYRAEVENFERAKPAKTSKKKRKTKAKKSKG